MRYDCNRKTKNKLEHENKTIFEYAQQVYLMKNRKIRKHQACLIMVVSMVV